MQVEEILNKEIIWVFISAFFWAVKHFFQSDLISYMISLIYTT